MSSIGMMDGAFFVGRKEIVDWVNSTLGVSIDKIEDTASGAIACQLLDIMHPNTVPMSKINWAAKKDFEFVANYKLLQTCFTKLHIDKYVDVDRLIKGKYQDNLEFMQWFKRFFEMSVSDMGDYDAVAQRSKGKGGAEYTGGKGGAVATTAPSRVSKPVEVKRAAPTSAPAPTAAAKKPLAPSAVNKAPSAAPSSRTAPTKPTSTSTTAGKTSATTTTSTAAAAAATEAMASLKAANATLSAQNAEMKLEMEGLVTERDFYFDKLRDVEMMLQELEDAGKGTPLTAAIFKILYATADGFETQKASADDSTLDAAVAAKMNGSSISSPLRSPARAAAPAAVVPAPVAEVALEVEAEAAPAPEADVDSTSVVVDAVAPSEVSAPEELETF